MRLPITPTFIEVLGSQRQPQESTRRLGPIGRRRSPDRRVVGVLQQVRPTRTGDVPAHTPLQEQVPMNRIWGG
jgi:hypothetical protein